MTYLFCSVFAKLFDAIFIHKLWPVRRFAVRGFKRKYSATMCSMVAYSKKSFRPIRWMVWLLFVRFWML